jgi:hypothetical protein
VSSLELPAQPFGLRVQGRGSILQFEEVPPQSLALGAQSAAAVPEVV